MAHLDFGEYRTRVPRQCTLAPRHRGAHVFATNLDSNLLDRMAAVEKSVMTVAEMGNAIGECVTHVLQHVCPDEMKVDPPVRSEPPAPQGTN
jgi:hypothetical protein